MPSVDVRRLRRPENSKRPTTSFAAVRDGTPPPSFPRLLTTTMRTPRTHRAPNTTHSLSAAPRYNTHRSGRVVYHPDKNSDAGVELIFNVVNNAYVTLTDEDKRAQYDENQYSANLRDISCRRCCSMTDECAERAAIHAAFAKSRPGGGFGVPTNRANHEAAPAPAPAPAPTPAASPPPSPPAPMPPASVAQQAPSAAAPHQPPPREAAAGAASSEPSSGAEQAATSRPARRASAASVHTPFTLRQSLNGQKGTSGRRSSNRSVGVLFMWSSLWPPRCLCDRHNRHNELPRSPRLTPPRRRR